MVSTELRNKLKSLPAEPGVYVFRGKEGETLYVGKAGSLRDRVASYFHSPRHLSDKTRRLTRDIHDVEVVTARSGAEALLLEDALVKKHRPRYNVRLRDDKRYPYVKLTAEPFPRVQVVRRLADDGARYFGPFTSSRAMRRTLKLAHKLFPLRTCKLEIGMDKPERPCLMHDLGRCAAPCMGLVTREEYGQAVKEAALLFEGRVDEVIQSLHRDMEAAAAEERFEHAARLRDHINSLDRIRQRQSVALTDPVDLDAVGVAAEGEIGYGVIMVVRGGRLIGREGFSLSVPAGVEGSRLLSAFLNQYYTRATAMPQEVLLPEELPEAGLVADYLGRRRGSRVRVRRPAQGERAALVDMAQRNARHALKRAALEPSSGGENALEDVAEALGLETRPWRIEAYDVSNLHGDEATGSMVVFVGGQPRPDAYRRFRVRTVDTPDDYAMLGEVLRRRLRHGLAELKDPTVSHGRFSDLPDLILVDGGMAQLSAAIQALDEFPSVGAEPAALAKRHELIYRPGTKDPIRLPPNSPALRLLQRVRDEAHRFAVDYHRSLRGRRALESLLDGVKGVGPRRKEALLKRFGSLEGLRQASLEELLSIPGLPKGTAEQLYKALHSG
ncbi:MAG: excinuclease ABC subunit UvrC [Candidatus Bipolaricaulota bacterium]